MDMLRDALTRCAAGEEDAVEPSLLERSDSVGMLAQAAAALTDRMEERLEQVSAQASQEAEECARRGMAESICRSALPQVLPDIPSRANFEVDGWIEQGTGQDSRFL